MGRWTGGMARSIARSVTALAIGVATAGGAWSMSGPGGPSASAALKRVAIGKSGRHGDIAAARIEGTDVWIVYIRAAGRCGSGGCVPQLWRRSGGRYVRVGSVTVAKLPIVVLPGMAGGMPLLGITVYDKQNDRSAVQPVTFDGRNYRARPDDPLLPEDAGTPLMTSSMLRGF